MRAASPGDFAIGVVADLRKGLLNRLGLPRCQCQIQPRRKRGLAVIVLTLGPVRVGHSAVDRNEAILEVPRRVDEL